MCCGVVSGAVSGEGGRQDSGGSSLGWYDLGTVRRVDGLGIHSIRSRPVLCLRGRVDGRE